MRKWLVGLYLDVWWRVRGGIGVFDTELKCQYALEHGEI